MAKGKPVLGRGLASLIPRQPSSGSSASSGRQDDGIGEEIIVNVDLDKIERNPYQPRADFDPVTLDELKRSIQEKGIIQPITVRRLDGGYQLISGERRVRASRDAGLKQIPAYIIRVHSNEEMLELALIENLQREHLNPIEIAISYKRLIDECHYSQEELGEKIGKDRSTVTNFLRLLKLPDPIQNAVRKGDLSGGHARALAGIEDGKLQAALFHKIVSRDLSVREVERLAREKSRPKRGHVSKGSAGSGSAISSVEEKLRQFLGTKVQLKAQQNGRGEIVIEYYSADDLERILEIFSTLEDNSR